LRNQDNQFLPKKQNISPYFEGHNSQSLFSFYTEPELFVDSKTGTTVEDRRIVSVMTTRPLHITFQEKGIPTTMFDAYYVDYLCVDKAKRKAGIAPQTIQTHHYNQRRMNRDILVSLFKREGELTGIVPLCVYTTHVFNMANWIRPEDFDATISLVECGPSNIHHFLDFLKDNTKKFDICIMSEVANILELIKTKNMYIYLLLRDDTIEAVYLFKKSCTEIRKGHEAIILFASINGLKKKHTNLFVQGFSLALFKIARGFSYAVIEDIADNYYILKELSEPEFKSPTAYFFYNYMCHPLKAKKSFIIC
jgi:hypothetical protein